MKGFEGHIMNFLIWLARCPKVWKLLMADKVVDDTRIGEQ